MDQDMLLKRLEWLDEEHRKDRTLIATLEKRVEAVEGGVPAVMQQIKDLSSELTRFVATLGRIDQVESSIVQVRVDLTRNLEAIEKLRAEHEREAEKVHRIEIEGLTKAIAEVRKGLDPIGEIKKGVQSRVEEDFRLARMIEELEQRIVTTRRNDEEYKRAQRILEEGRRQDNKRLTDLVGEVSALRKRIDEHRGKVDLTVDQFRKIETRLSELSTAENERRQAQASFIEKQTLIQVERERLWKEWLVRFEAVEKQAAGLDSQWQAIDATHRSVKRSQDALDEVTQRIERRINEVTEMQRLAEDRFRQDWTAFRADDQKRWTNYTISQEEQQREIAHQFEKIDDRFAAIEDMTQDIQDMLTQINEETEKRLQGLLTLAHEFMSAYERAFSRPISGG